MQEYVEVGTVESKTGDMVSAPVITSDEEHDSVLPADGLRSPMFLKVAKVRFLMLLGCCLVTLAFLFATSGGGRPVHAPQATKNLFSSEESVLPPAMPCYGSSEAVLPGRSGVQRRRRAGRMCSCRRRSGMDSNGYQCSGGSFWSPGEMQAPPADGPNTVYLMRHAEKLSMFGCLNCAGRARANNLENVFNGGSFQKPKAIFAYNYSEDAHCERTSETAQPLADALGITVDRTHGGSVWHAGAGYNENAATAIKATLAAGGGPVLVVWESLNTMPLTYELGGPPPLVDGNIWDSSSDYDSVYTFTYDDDFNIISFNGKGQQDYSPPDCVDS